MQSPLVKVFIAIVLAIAAGALTGRESDIFGILWIDLFNLLGQLFLNALTLVVVPLVVSSIIIGSARIGQEQEFGKLGRRTFFFFILINLSAVLIGAAAVMTLAPGKMIDASLLQNLTGAGALPQLESQAAGGLFPKIEQLLLRIVPSNIIATAAQAQMLGLILFSLLFGFFTARIETKLSETLLAFWNGVFQVMMLMTKTVMKALPIGVFGLMARVVATTGLEAVKPVGMFFITVLVGLACFVFLFLPFLLKFVARTSPIAHFKAVFPALLTAFSTSSTAATLPVTIECMEKHAKIPNRFCSFILPLGTSINLAGSALYATVAVLFIAQAYGLPIETSVLLTAILMCFFIGMGMVAGIPSASLIAIIIILQTLGLPKEGVVLLMAVERVLDMFRTTASVFSNSCCASLVYHLERDPKHVR